jgi:hypothetical protein
LSLDRFGHKPVPRHLTHDIKDCRGYAGGIHRLRKRGRMGLDRAHHGRARLGPAVLFRPDRIFDGANEGQHCHKAAEPQRSARWNS